MQRYARDQGSTSAPNLADLLPYVDFADAFQILNGSASSLDRGEAEFLRENTRHLQKLIPVRNRVAHTRPLEFDDLPTVLDVAKKFSIAPEIDTPKLDQTLSQLERDPSFVLGLEIRFPDVAPEASGRHNLPIPDFDETGFIGRKSVIRSLIKTIRGPYPVISLVGDGGIGKTSLALKAAYEILDSHDSPFDAVVWTTAKNSLLTASEIKRIQGAVKDSLGMLRVAAEELGGKVASADPMQEVLEYMQHFKVLLILDNLETVLDAKLREFLRELPNGSKVLITSRIGIGALENPIRIEPLEKSEAISLLRALAKIRNVAALLDASPQALDRIVERTSAHPLYIKWFVSVVQSGRRPEDALNSGLLLDYCMSNVYGYISETGKLVLRSMQTLNGAHNQAELAYLNELDVKQLQTAILELITTNFVLMRTSSAGNAVVTEYELSEFAQDYLEKHHPVGDDEQRWLREMNAGLFAYGEQISLNAKSNRYDEKSLDVRDAKDFSVAAKLLDSLSLIYRGEHGTALQVISDAQELAPDYHECYRLEAMARAASHNLHGANTAYEKALELNSSSSTLNWFYARFLIREFGQPQEGLRYLQKAVALDPASTVLKLEIAKVHHQLANSEAAREACVALLRIPETPLEIKSRALEIYVKSATLSAGKMYGVGDYGGCLELLEYLQETLGGLQGVAADNLVRDRISYGMSLARGVRIKTADKYLARSATMINIALSQWLGVGFNEAVDRSYGSVKAMQAERGFGFLRPTDGGPDIFFHATDFRPTEEFSLVREGSELSYKKTTKDGKIRAVEVWLVER
ncbi:cold shock CspA family protein/tetratricopeptide (TPR) repeat protein [Kitasatospora gansuensis]|uniref:Cold shock CspA family protein/tetratricopeptide (TPR) repeat protein n=1 Tax=Kitasatospora gansuensis TaxID=258050 RepID=A0A7W7S7C2_9ACTN|nr:NB-ARC domain-containing protein [Kitasatospora gansuensis]MBB4944887.1 cold shock CspA family protein/tetratricopeptide (TPR) repeat protein [Kitasatospora gansuensis]